MPLPTPTLTPRQLAEMYMTMNQSQHWNTKTMKAKLVELLSKRDEEVLGDRLPRDEEGRVFWVHDHWAPWGVAKNIMDSYTKDIKTGNAPGITLTDVIETEVQLRDEQYQIWALEPGDKVEALKHIDPDGADAHPGTVGVVFERWNVYGDGGGPMVNWNPNGGCCNVYPGQVKKV